VVEGVDLMLELQVRIPRGHDFRFFLNILAPEDGGWEEKSTKQLNAYKKLKLVCGVVVTVFR
jgi:hypothetical protein